MQPLRRLKLFEKKKEPREETSLPPKDAPSPQSRFSRSTLMIGAGTLASRLLGFVRDAGIAWLLGGSGTADALTAALRIPYMARRLFGEGTLSLSLTAACIRERLNGGSGCGLALAVTRRLAWRAGLLALLLMLGAEGVMRLSAPGLAARPEALAEATSLFRICVPYICCVMLAAGCMAALHSRRHFLLPSLTPLLFNLSVIASALIACAHPQRDAGALIACGVLCGGLLQWLAQIPAVARLRREEATDAPLLGESVRAVVRRIPAGILGAAMPQLAFLGASALASLLPEGNMASLFYAERLLEFPLGVLGAAVGMAAAPRLAELAAAEGLLRPSPSPGLHRLHERPSSQGDCGPSRARSSLSKKGETPFSRKGTATDSSSSEASFSSEIRRALLLALGLNLPAAAGLAAVAVPLVALTLGHGAFDDKALAATSLALCAYAPGLPAYALSRPLLAACHALDNGIPLRAAACGVCVSLVSGSVMTLHGGAWGPPLGVCAGLWCNAALLWRGVARSVPLRLPLRSLTVQGLGSLLTFGTAWALVRGLSHASAVAQIAAAVPAGAAVYGLCLAAGDRRLFAFLRRSSR